MSSPNFTHWCSMCNQPVHLHAGDSACPNCYEGFVQELVPAAHGADPAPQFQYREPSQGGGFGIMNLLATMLGTPMPEIEPPRMASVFHPAHPLPPPDFHELHPIDPRYYQELRTAVEPAFHGHHPAHLPDFHEPYPSSELDRYPYDSFHNSSPSTRQIEADHGDVTLTEMMESYTQGPTQGPPPAPRSAIEALPTVEIKQKDLTTDAKCPVCQDEFKLGKKAKKMPCNHIYHKKCIDAWLSEHNSCPVCRIVLNSDGSGSSSSSSSSSSSTNLSRSGSMSRSGRRRHPLSCFGR